MSLAYTIARVRSGLFQITFINANNKKIGSGSAFSVNNLLVTNNHIYAGHLGAHRVGLRRDDMPSGEFRIFSPQEFASRLIAGSQACDYAVLKVPEILKGTDHQFSLEAPKYRRIGNPIALLGFPLEHDNLTCHQGIISSIHQQHFEGVVDLIQVDASVNAGNSGGPLIDPATGAVIGIVTGKATGLSKVFDELRNSVRQNIKAVEAVRGGGQVRILGVDLVQVIIASQKQMLVTMDEIERQTNVGIGYAISASHLLDEPCLQV